MGLYDTIDIDMGPMTYEGVVWEWQTKDLGRNMNVLKDGDPQLANKSIKVNGYFHIEGTMSFDANGRLIAFKQDPVKSPKAKKAPQLAGAVVQLFSNFLGTSVTKSQPTASTNSIFGGKK